MDDAMKSRAIINNIPDTKVSFNDMVIKACYGIKETSKVNSQWKEEAITINHHVSMVLL
jgi:pyruvate dehydrogenase E2 component (dihydrolipoamide acetyltransferase)